jgi:hypothetical protein
VLICIKLISTIVFGFIIPWIVGFMIYVKDKRVIAVISPFACMLAFVLNTIGIHFGFFYPKVGDINPYIITAITNMGLFTIEPCLLIFAVIYTRLKPLYLIGGMTLLSQLIDQALISQGFLEYAKGWSFFSSVIAYIISFYTVYLYYLLLKKINLFHELKGTLK